MLTNPKMRNLQFQPSTKFSSPKSGTRNCTSLQAHRLSKKMLWVSKKSIILSQNPAASVAFCLTVPPGPLLYAHKLGTKHTNLHQLWPKMKSNKLTQERFSGSECGLIDPLSNPLSNLAVDKLPRRYTVPKPIS